MGLKPKPYKRPIFLQCFDAVGWDLSHTYTHLNYCISHYAISHRAAAEPGPKVRRECPTTISSFGPSQGFAANPGDATVP